MNQEAILSLLRTVVHPEMGSNIVENGIVEEILLDGEKLRLTLNFPKARDPFALSIKRQVDTLIRENYPSLTNINILIKEQAPKTPAPKTVPTGRIAAVDHIIAIASGKGGVGKSTVAANLAVTLARMGYRVGLLDADIYGPSLPRMFGVDGYTPAAAESDGKEFIVPAESLGVKLMSIGFFIRPSDALVWRGPMATNALRQLIRDTQWGALDFLLIDRTGVEAGRCHCGKHPATGGSCRRASRRRDVPYTGYRRAGSRAHRKHGLVHARRTAGEPLLPLRKGGCETVCGGGEDSVPRSDSDRSIGYGGRRRGNPCGQPTRGGRQEIPGGGGKTC